MRPSDRASAFEHRGFRGVLDGECAGLLDIADDVDATGFRDADLFPALELDVEFRVRTID